jgi:NodT family efflux transporter outer membrane factor (OMF) lipoprotein
MSIASKSLRIQAGIALLLLVGCKAGPDYDGPPETVSASETAFRRADDVQTVAGPLGSRWWASLRDVTLNSLEDAALASSPDLDAATARLRQSRAGLQGQQAGLLPTTGVSAAYLHAHTGTNPLAELSGGSGAGSADDVSFYTAGFDASWEPDFFGGQRRAVESAAADAQARAADLAAAQVSLTADVAQAYVTLRDVQNRLGLAQNSAGLQQKILDLTKLRLAGGTASELDMQRLNTQVESTKAALAPLRAQIEQQLNRLAVLTGKPPGALDAELATPAALPAPPATVMIGDPAALLRRRPDIQAAERRIAACNAVIGQRVADFFPKLNLLGDLGFGSAAPGQLFSGGSVIALAAPMLQWTPFDFGRTRARVDEAEAARDEAMAQYRGAVLKALDDAETSLSRFGRQRENVAGLSRVKISADRAAALTRQRNEGGTAPLIDLLDTERQRLQAEQDLAQAEAALTQDFIGLQKSLGLGWSAQ